MHGNKYWYNTDICWIVNGQINKADANFRGNFLVNQIGDSNLYTGPHPKDADDVSKIVEYGCSAILDIQKETDMRLRGISHEHMEELFRNRGITNIQNFPVSDLDLNEYCGMLFKASKILNKLLNTRGERVFMHCSTGCSRSMTVLVVYFALFLKHPEW